MRLVPLENFSGNGVLRGTIAALGDGGDPLGWEAYGNWSDPTFRAKSVKGLVSELGIDTDRARSGIALSAARNLSVGIAAGARRNRWPPRVLERESFLDPIHLGYPFPCMCRVPGGSGLSEHGGTIVSRPTANRHDAHPDGSREVRPSLHDYRKCGLFFGENTKPDTTIPIEDFSSRVGTA